MRAHRVVLAALAAFLICAPAAARHHRPHAHHHAHHHAHRAQRHHAPAPTNIFHRTWHWLMSIQNDIVAYARQHGLDPAYALAVAERESSFDPNAHASKTIHGLFQMSGAERQRLGIPLTTDVATQTEGFARYTQGLHDDMASRLGREPTPSELYLGHYWGPGRAAGVITGHYSGLRARDVFTPRELAENPNLKPDKPVEDIATGIEHDMDRRYAKFGGQVGTNPGAPNSSKDFDPSPYLTPTADTAGDTSTAAADGADAKTAAVDPSAYLTPSGSTDNPTVKTAMSPDDLSQVPAPARKMASILPPSSAPGASPAPAAAPLPVSPSFDPSPSSPTPPASSSGDEDPAMTTAALNDTGGAGLGDNLSGFASDLGSAMSKQGSDSRPASSPSNSSAEILQQLALAQQAQTPVEGMPSLPGQPTSSSSLPGSNQRAPSYLDPRMFGIQPQQS